VDWIGGLTLIALIVSMMTFLGQLSYGFAPTPPILLLALIFVLSFFGFIINESRQKSPLLDLSIFRYRMFVLPSISMILFFVANLMITVLGPFYFEGVRGYTASQVGLIFLIVPAITVFGAPLTGAVYDRHQFRYLAALGMSIMALSMIALGFLAMSTANDIRQLLICFVFMGLGAAFFQSPNNTELMRALPVSKINIASSFTATIRNLGMALGVSLSGLLVSLQMAQAGYYGTISDAGPAILASSISRVMMIAGGLCIISAIVAIYRGSKMK
jgi:Major Facilitator Superfamily.